MLKYFWKGERKGGREGKREEGSKEGKREEGRKEGRPLCTVRLGSRHTGWALSLKLGNIRSSSEAPLLVLNLIQG